MSQGGPSMAHSVTTGAYTPGTLHVVFTSECHNSQFDWFSVGLYHAFQCAQQPVW